VRAVISVSQYLAGETLGPRQGWPLALRISLKEMLLNSPFGTGQMYKLIYDHRLMSPTSRCGSCSDACTNPETSVGGKSVRRSSTPDLSPPGHVTNISDQPPPVD
jgi:hypothetical protein